MRRALTLGGELLLAAVLCAGRLPAQDSLPPWRAGAEVQLGFPGANGIGLHLSRMLRTVAAATVYIDGAFFAATQYRDRPMIINPGGTHNDTREIGRVGQLLLTIAGSGGQVGRGRVPILVAAGIGAYAGEWSRGTPASNAPPSAPRGLSGVVAEAGVRTLVHRSAPALTFDVFGRYYHTGEPDGFQATLALGASVNW